jgi:2-isopropylmalate synthase
MLEKLEAEGLIVNYNKMSQNLPATLPGRVLIWDETLRDGEQTPAVSLSLEEKIEITKLMDEMGIAIIDVGFPAVSKTEKNTVKAIASEGFKQASIAAPARALRADIDACIEAGVDEIPIFVAFSDLHLKYKLRMTKEEVIERVTDCVEYAKGHGIVVDFVTEDTSRTSVESTVRIFSAALKAGADRVVIADTVGFLRPLSMKYLVAQIRDRIWEEFGRKVPLSVHCHNDFGLATANTLAAVEEGVTVPHTCVAGFGERAGNAPLEEVVLALEILYNVRTGVKTERLYELAQLTEKSFAIPLPVHKAIIGDNAFSHEAGIHVHGMMAHSLCYEPIPPALVGRKTTFHLGKFTGKRVIESRLKAEGLKATPEQIRQIMEKIKRLQESRSKREILEIFHQVKDSLSEIRKGVTDEEFWRVVEEVTGQKPKSDSSR